MLPEERRRARGVRYDLPEAIGVVEAPRVRIGDRLVVRRRDQQLGRVRM